MDDSSIFEIKTEDEFRKFYDQNLVWKSEEELENIIKRFSTKEFRYMYTILYSSPYRANYRKIDLLRHIQNYFMAIDRAKSLKP